MYEHSNLNRLKIKTWYGTLGTIGVESGDTEGVWVDTNTYLYENTTTEKHDQQSNSNQLDHANTADQSELGDGNNPTG